MHQSRSGPRAAAIWPPRREHAGAARWIGEENCAQLDARTCMLQRNVPGGLVQPVLRFHRDVLPRVARLIAVELRRLPNVITIRPAQRWAW